jgi:carbon monoxide dehydrogenase subunit G
MPRETLWSLLHDASRMKDWIPGCEKLEPIGPDRYAATLKVGVAAIKGSYSGYVQISEKEFPSRYVLAVEGKAAPGFVRGTATMKLDAKDANTTVLTVYVDGHVGGLIASVGQRFLNGIATQLTQQLLDNIEKEALRPVEAQDRR